VVSKDYVIGFSTQELEEALNHCTATDINLQDEEGKTALAWAALAGDVESTRMLLEAGADPNITDHSLDTPLMFAVYSTNPEVIPVLLSHGANFTANDRLDTALHKAAFRQDDVRYFQPFLDAALKRDARFDPDIQSDCQEPPLCMAALQDHAEAAAFFIRNGADMNITDETVQTTMLWDTIKYKCHKVMKVLLQMGADISYVHPDESTIFHYSAEWAELEAVGILKEHVETVDVDAHNAMGFTALEIAERRTIRPNGFVAVFADLIDTLRTVRNEKAR
jgi:ankyrin repeat protein